MITVGALVGDRGLSYAVQRNIAVLLSAQAISAGAITLSVALGSVMARRLTGSDEVSGIPATVNLVAGAFAAYSASRLMAARGRRVGLSAGYMLGAIGAVVAASFAIAGSFLGFLLGSAMVGGGNAFIQLSRYAAAELVPVAIRGRTVGLMLFGSVIGAMLAVGLARIVERGARSFDIDTIQLSWLTAGVLLACGAALVGSMFRSMPPAPTPEVDGALPVEDRSTWQVLRAPTVLLGMLSLVTAQGVMVMLMNLMPLHADHLGASLPTISLLFSGHFVGMFGFALVTGRLVDRWGARIVSASGGGLMISSAVVAILAVTPLDLGLSLFLLGLGWNFCFVSGSTLLTEALRPAERTKVQGTIDFFGYLAAATCVAGGGIAFGAFGFEAVAVLGLVLASALVAALSIGWLRRAPIAATAADS